MLWIKRFCCYCSKMRAKRWLNWQKKFLSQVRLVGDAFKQLEEAGVIAGYHASLSRQRLGFGVTGFIHLQMENHSPEITLAFEREVVALPEVLSCHNLSGHYDYMLELIATDLEAFSNLVRNKIRSLPGVREISTSFSLKEIKRTAILPLR